jgi:hypothetical protein
MFADELHGVAVEGLGLLRVDRVSGLGQTFLKPLAQLLLKAFACLIASAKPGTNFWHVKPPEASANRKMIDNLPGPAILLGPEKQGGLTLIQESN